MKMKKVFYLSMLAAIGLFLSACSSSEEEVNSPDLVTGVPVKAQFTISIPLGTGTATRQTDAIVQNAENIASFRGINDIKLFPSLVALADFNKDADGSGTIDAGEWSAIQSPISLAQLLKPTQQLVNEYIPSGQLLTNSNSVLFGDVLLSSGTQTFLFYGKAIGKGATEDLTSYTADDRFKYGFLTTSGLSGNPANVSSFVFSPQSIVTNISANAPKRANILAYLNSIVGANIGSGTTDTWDNTDNAVLRNLYIKFTSMRAGSSNTLQAALEDLYNAVKDDAHTLAQAIKTKIENTLYVTITPGTAGDPEAKLTFNNAYTTNPTTGDVTSYDIAGYPSESDNLPDGAAVIQFDGTTKAFKYVGNDTNYAPLNVAALSSYAYPANLYYWVKSDIKTSTSSRAADYTGSMTWNSDATTGIFSKYEEGAAITANTRSVLLTEPVQYGVGRLDVSVGAAGATIPDNGTGSESHNVDISKLKLTGILIGSQRNVGWNFEPIAGDGIEYSIFDNILKSKKPDTGTYEGESITTSLSYVNSTLVLETQGGTSATESVNVALEFINNDQDFWGKDNQIIPKGCKFYLVGKLDISDATSLGGTATPGNKVFKQDYKTIANFTINNLKKATNTIPDLRNPSIELGLSVDLHWEAGYTFNYTFN